MASGLDRFRLAPEARERLLVRPRLTQGRARFFEPAAWMKKSAERTDGPAASSWRGERCGGVINRAPPR